MLVKRTDLLTGEPYYEDLTTRTMFRRTVGGIAWPYGNQSGTVVILGEKRTPSNNGRGRRHIYMLKEFRSMESEELLVNASLFQRRYMPDLYVMLCDEPRYILLEEYNDRQRRARRPILRTDHPSTWHGKGEGLIQYYAELVRRRIGDEKSLFFGKDCSARDAFRNLRPDDVGKKAMELPHVCAFAWALEYFDVNPMAEWGERGFGGKMNIIADSIGGY
ncbi:MAG: hypothetical protein R3Y11_01860 [Pseudomonadota bacterium]